MFTANVNLYHLTKFSLYLSFTVYYLNKTISRFTLVSSINIVLNSFYLFIFYFQDILNLKLTFVVCRERDSKSL